MALHDGVSGAALLSLLHKLHAEWRDLLAHARCLVADDAVDVCGGDNLAGGAHHVAQQGKPGDVVQHLGQLALEPRALTGGQDGDGKSWSGHCAFIVKQRGW